MSALVFFKQYWRQIGVGALFVLVLVLGVFLGTNIVTKNYQEKADLKIIDSLSKEIKRYEVQAKLHSDSSVVYAQEAEKMITLDSVTTNKVLKTMTHARKEIAYIDSMSDSVQFQLQLFAKQSKEYEDSSR